MTHFYRGYMISYDRHEGLYNVRWSGKPEIIESTTTLDQARADIDGWLNAP